MISYLVPFEVAWDIPFGFSRAAPEGTNLTQVLYYIGQPHADALRDTL